METEEHSKSEIDRMLRQSQTKVIFPVMTYGLLQEYVDSGQSVFRDSEVKKAYHKAVRHIADCLQHNLHIGGKYYDAYPARNLPRYGVVKVLSNNLYEIASEYRDNAASLLEWIPGRVKDHITERLGIVPELAERSFRAELSADMAEFSQTIAAHIGKTSTNFEIFSFAVIRVHLEKFACKVYRDTRTSAHDSGVDLSTNFGVVYQIKKLKVLNKSTAQSLYAELKLNFDTQRLNDGNVILVIDDISKDVKQYLIDMKVQSISKHDILKLASEFEDVEDREKVLRIIYEEFGREYGSSIA